MNDSLISRQAAIDALDSINCCGWVEDSWKKVCGIIERVPSERKKGKWICESMDDYKCSICGEIVLRHKYRFCPNCGAEMEVER